MNTSTGMFNLLLMVFFILIIYFLMIRPQRKRDKEVKAMRESLSAGDEIVTIGGIVGKIIKTKDNSVVIQVGADKIKLEIVRTAVGSVTKMAARPKSYKEEIEEEAPKTPTKKVIPKKLSKKNTADAEPEEVKTEDSEKAK